MNITILVPNADLIISSISGTLEIFNKVNTFHRASNPETGIFFNVFFVGNVTERYHFLASYDLCGMVRID